MPSVQGSKLHESKFSVLCQEQELAKVRLAVEQSIEEHGTEGLVSRDRPDTKAKPDKKVSGVSDEGLSVNASALGQNIIEELASARVSARSGHRALYGNGRAFWSVGRSKPHIGTAMHPFPRRRVKQDERIARKHAEVLARRKPMMPVAELMPAIPLPPQRPSEIADPHTESGPHGQEAENTIPLSPGKVPPSLSQVSSIELRIINNRLGDRSLDPRQITKEKEEPRKKRSPDRRQGPPSNQVGLTYEKSQLTDTQAVLPPKSYQFAPSPVQKLQQLPFKNIRIRKDPKREVAPAPPRQRVQTIPRASLRMQVS
jgi:hypothetical protein